jgi:hypothetical protein
MAVWVASISFGSSNSAGPNSCADAVEPAWLMAPMHKLARKEVALAKNEVKYRID